MIHHFFDRWLHPAKIEKDLEKNIRELSTKYAIQKDINLARYTSLRIGGNAQYFVEPESRSELEALLVKCSSLDIPYLVMGRGSNLFISGKHISGLVIRNTKACTDFSFSKNRVTTGASVALQTLLKEAARNGLGGCEYLYSVPGNVGGAIFMNAGRGEIAMRNISDHVVNIEIFDGKRIRTLSRRQCRFGYRTSVFHKMPKAVVLSAELQFESIAPEEAQSLLRNRLKFVKKKQDNTTGNAGSVFSRNYVLGDELRGVREGQASFSEKTSNWILNHGDCVPEEVQSLVDRAIQMHMTRNLKKPVLEWNVWSE